MGKLSQIATASSDSTSILLSGAENGGFATSLVGQTTVVSFDSKVVVGKPKITAKDRQHWAFLPLARPQLPTVNNAEWTRTPIDRFILAELEANQLSPSAPADKATLLRRVYFDLVGLPTSVDPVKLSLRQIGLVTNSSAIS
jgi:hypothetical protein